MATRENKLKFFYLVSYFFFIIINRSWILMQPHSEFISKSFQSRKLQNIESFDIGVCIILFAKHWFSSLMTCALVTTLHTLLRNYEIGLYLHTCNFVDIVSLFHFKFFEFAPITFSWLISIAGICDEEWRLAIWLTAVCHASTIIRNNILPGVRLSVSMESISNCNRR